MKGKRGTAQTLNQWLKRTILKIGFSHPVSCHFSPNPLDSDNTSTLDVVIKVQSTLRFLAKASNGFSSHKLEKIVVVIGK
jgi:hypothetical protein